MRTCQLIFLSQHSAPVTWSVTVKEHTHRLFSCTDGHLPLVGEQTLGSRKRNYSFWSEDTTSRSAWSRSTSMELGLMSWGTPRGRQMWVLGSREAAVGAGTLLHAFLGLVLRAAHHHPLSMPLLWKQSRSAYFLGGKRLIPCIIDFKKQ